MTTTEEMNMKKFIGGMMLFSGFASIFTMCLFKYGVLGTLLVFGVSSLLAGLIIGGTILLADD
jgi:uncharacterized membrane protein